MEFRRGLNTKHFFFLHKFHTSKCLGREGGREVMGGGASGNYLGDKIK